MYLKLLYQEWGSYWLIISKKYNLTKRQLDFTCSILTRSCRSRLKLRANIVSVILGYWYAIYRRQLYNVYRKSDKQAHKTWSCYISWRGCEYLHDDDLQALDVSYHFLYIFISLRFLSFFIDISGAIIFLCQYVEVTYKPFLKIIGYVSDWQRSVPSRESEWRKHEVR